MSSDLKPREVVAELDRYIVGQTDAKRAVAVAVRNRWRRQQLDSQMRDDVMPKNIIMIGPTGVGKTEIARRLASLTGAPFTKVEASKYTEVGYHGRDVESMIRDLVKLSVNMVTAEKQEDVREKAAVNAEERLLDALLPPLGVEEETRFDSVGPDTSANQEEIRSRTREKLRQQLQKGKLDAREIEIQVTASSEPIAHVFGSMGGEEVGSEVQSAMDRLLPKRTKDRKTTVAEARRLLEQEEAAKLIDEDALVVEAIARAENEGIVFIDEIDKIAGGRREGGPDVSREGVQRDLLPIVEGTTVTTRHGIVNTDHILFVAAGAFHMSKPSDLIPELQGRFPIRVELSPLDREDFVRILTHPKNALTKQYEALLATEGLNLSFQADALERIAEIATEANRTAQDIGARRLHTVMERLLEEISFDAPDLKNKKIIIDRAMVDNRLKDIVEDQDLTKYVL
jgi:ATP-dependent HslUV protease ATP-binding subunit HslU